MYVSTMLVIKDEYIISLVQWEFNIPIFYMEQEQGMEKWLLGAQ